MSRVTIEYQDRNGAITTREIDPISIDGDMIFAYCHLRHDYRHFRISRILFLYDENGEIHDPRAYFMSDAFDEDERELTAEELEDLREYFGIDLTRKPRIEPLDSPSSSTSGFSRWSRRTDAKHAFLEADPKPPSTPDKPGTDAKEPAEEEEKPTAFQIIGAVIFWGFVIHYLIKFIGWLLSR